MAKCDILLFFFFIIYGEKWYIMKIKENYVGKTFDRLIIIKEVDKDNNGKRKFLCKCSCGNEKIVRLNDLKSGKTKSCGCLQKEKSSEGIKNKKDWKLYRNDLSGKTFGKLTVLKLDKEETLRQRKEKNNNFSYWQCLCECGNVISVRSTQLTGSKTKSCGCLQKSKASENIKKIQPLGAQSKLINLTGKTFYNLTVLKRDEQNTKWNKPKWVCSCKCGNIISVAGSSLTSGLTKSCGCLGLSMGQEIIKNILLNNNISFSQEVKFNNLKDKSYLRFDFALLDPKGSIIKLIEYDGRQHFDNTSQWYNEDTLKHDKMKNDFCKENNIPLLRISYKEQDKITLEYLLNGVTNL